MNRSVLKLIVKPKRTRSTASESISTRRFNLILGTRAPFRVRLVIITGALLRHAEIEHSYELGFKVIGKVANGYMSVSHNLWVRG